MAWKTLKTRKIFKNELFELNSEKCQKESGEIIENYYKVKKPDAAVIAGFTSKNELLMIEQYRHPVRSTDLEIPAGYKEKNDKNIKETAIREFEEETGYKIEKIIKIGEAFAQAGFLTNRVHFFIAFNAKKNGKMDLDKNEEIKLKLYPVQKAFKFLSQGKIKDMGSVTGLLLAQKYLREKNE